LPQLFGILFVEERQNRARRGARTMRMISVRWTLALAIAICLSTVAFAQTSTRTAPSAELGDSVVARFVGTWEGSGWMTGRDGSRSEYEAFERVRWHLSGKRLIIEGLGVATDAQTGETVIGHDAMAVISAHEDANTWTFTAGRDGAFEAHVMTYFPEEDFFRWSPDPPDRTSVRFTIRFTTEDEWHEVGEFSPNGGQSWTPFLEMRLQRVPD
jgi:hypothetical protein